MKAKAVSEIGFRRELRRQVTNPALPLSWKAEICEHEYSLDCDSDWNVTTYHEDAGHLSVGSYLLVDLHDTLGGNAVGIRAQQDALVLAPDIRGKVKDHGEVGVCGKIFPRAIHSHHKAARGAAVG